MSETYDLVVVGGGIHGVGVAQAAAAAGQRVLLVEKQALAAGTSHASSKLIHGGLRYLESLELGLVFESLSERARLLRLAPDLVRLQAFHIPLYPETRRGRWLLRAGLSLYAVLGGLRPETRFSSLPRSAWSGLDGLRTDGLRAVFRYYDGQSDDVALTHAVMHSARTLGAELAIGAECTDGRIEAGGCEVELRAGERTWSVRSRAVVNAAGPWVNTVLSRLAPAAPQRPIELVQGTHVEVPGKLEAGIYYVESPRDGRAVFVMPWRDRMLVGTTETRFTGDPDQVRPLESEQQYLVRVLGHYFPRLAETPVQDRWAGLRVLPSGSGHAFHRSRETILDTWPGEGAEASLLTIYGGKLTAYRATAEKVIAKLRRALPERTPVADTRELPLEPVRVAGQG